MPHDPHDLSRSSLMYALAGGGEGAWHWDLAGGAIKFSSAFKQMLRFDEATFDAAFDFRSHLHPEDREPTLQAMQAAIDGGHPFRRDHRLRCGDGAYRWFRGRGLVFRDEAGRALRFAGLLAELGPEERREARDRGKNEILAGIARGAPLAETLGRLVRWIENEEEVLGSILVARDGRLRLGVASSLPESYNAAVDGLAPGEGVGSCGTAFATGRRVIVEDIATHPDWREARGLATRAGLAACWSEPIRGSDGSVLGTFALYSRRPRGPSPEELALVGEAANLAAIAIERDQSMAALRRNEARFRDFAQAGGDWFWETDAEHRFTWMSESIEAVLGVTAEWHFGKRREEIAAELPDPEREPWRSHLEALRRHEPFRGLRLLRRLPSGPRWVETSGTPVFDETGAFAGYRGIGRDVTREVELEAAAAAADARLRAAIEVLDSGVTITDAEDRIVYANARMRAWHSPIQPYMNRGRRYAEHLHAAVVAGLVPEAEGREEAWLAERLARRAAPGEPFVVQRQDGLWLMVYEQRMPDGGIVTVGVDITQQRQAMVQLRNAERAFRELFELNPAPMLVYDLESLRIVAANEMALVQYGYTLDEFKAITVLDIRPPEDVPIALASIEALRTDGRKRDDRTWRHRKRDGTIIEVRTAARRVRFGERSAGLVAAIDVTEQRAAEAALRELNEQLERRVAERTVDLERALREMEALSYSISHDLRAPLRAINGFAAIIAAEETERLSPEGRRMFARVQTKARDMGLLIEDLLALFKVIRTAPAADRVDMTALAREVAETLAPPYPHTQWTVAELPAAVGDGALLRQVWLNLLDNAFKYTCKVAAPEIAVGYEPAQGAYFVCDNGAGFDPGHAEKLFGVFQRLHLPAEFPGTGVGLAIVARIVERHGGRAWAESAGAGGATFYFTLGG